jgi:hypothetical protein
MPFSSIPMRDDMINASVNALYNNLGVDKIKTTEAIQKKGVDKNWDGFIDKDELKIAIKNDVVAISLKEYKDKDSFFDSTIRLFNSYDVASDVSSRMDKSDGKNDGYITIPAGKYYAQNIVAGSLTTSLVSGEAVIGREIQDRKTAKGSGLTLIELHQNKSGAKLVMGQ